MPLQLFDFQLTAFYCAFFQLFNQLLPTVQNFRNVPIYEGIWDRRRDRLPGCPKSWLVSYWSHQTVVIAASLYFLVESYNYLAPQMQLSSLTEKNCLILQHKFLPTIIFLPLLLLVTWLACSVIQTFKLNLDFVGHWKFQTEVFLILFSIYFVIFTLLLEFNQN